MNDDQMLAVIFGITTGLIILFGMGLGLLVSWIVL